MSFSIIRSLPTVAEVVEQYPLSADLRIQKAKRDKQIADIFTGADTRMAVIVGPCSVDYEKSVLEYVVKLAKLQEQVASQLVLIPRIYTNKPRTNGLGYKGLLHQPNPHQTPDICAGILALRRLHLTCFAESGLTAADEMLYPDALGYLSDLLGYIAVGARSVENQQHRLVASGADVPVGMKNPTGGDLKVMFNAVYAAQNAHRFAYQKQEVQTSGNPLAHVILRGYSTVDGDNVSNYHYEDLKRVEKLYQKLDTLKNPAVIVDANHANSGKNYAEQPRIVRDVMESRRENAALRQLVKGVMVESYLIEGRQDTETAVYGQSITDACLGWADTERLILDMADWMG